MEKKQKPKILNITKLCGNRDVLIKFIDRPGTENIYKADAKKLLKMLREYFSCGTMQEFVKLANKIKW